VLGHRESGRSKRAIPPSGLGHNILSTHQLPPSIDFEVSFVLVSGLMCRTNYYSTNGLRAAVSVTQSGKRALASRVKAR
jgi:hypothetical protein